MWLNDLVQALQVLYEIYGETCTVKSIEDNEIVMSNFHRYNLKDLLEDDEED